MAKNQHYDYSQLVIAPIFLEDQLLPGTLEYAIHYIVNWVIRCSFKWLNRRGGKRRSFTGKAFSIAIDRLGIAKPELIMVHRKHRVFA